MASGTRSKADSDMKQKIAELRELAAVMYDDEAKQKEYVRAEFEKEREESRKEKEREHEIAMEREKREAEVAIAIAKEKEITEREREKEKQITERERIAAEKENGTASQASSGSRPASPASQQSSSNGLPHMPMEHFDDKTENIEVYLVRFEEVASYYGLPEEKWCFRLSQCLRGKAYEVYSKLPSGQREDYAALKQALLVQFELTAEAYQKKFRTSRLERRETYGNLCDRLDKYLKRWHTLSELPETLDGLVSLILAEQLLECMPNDVKIFVREQQAATPADIASAADRYATARKDVKDIKSKTSASDKPEDQSTSSNKHAPSSQPSPFAKPHHQKAPIQRPATPTSYDRRSHPPRHGQTNNHHRDRNSTSDHRPNRQHQAPRTVSAVTELPEPSLHNQPSPLDEEEEDYYVISALTVAPEPTACGLTQPIPPHPIVSPPGVEIILINGSPVQALFDSGCEVSSVISKALVDPSDLTGGSVTVQSLDRGIPPKVYPIARVHVECKYVHGTIDAVVMDSPVYDFVLGSRYIPLGVVDKPYFSLPVGRTTKQKGGSNQPVGSPGRHSNKSFTGSSAKLKPRHPGTGTAGKSRGERNNYTREGPFNSCSSAIKPLIPGTGTARKSRGKRNTYTRESPCNSRSSAIKPLIPGTDPARKSQRKVNFHSRESGPHHGSTHTLRPLFPDIDRVWKIRGKPINRTHEETPHYGFRDKPRPTYAHWALRHNFHPTYWSAPRRRCTQSYPPGLFPQVSRIAPSTWQSACGQNIGDSGPLGRTPLWTLATS
ncbi:uncharacterized protein LOC129926885 [Biomphalaria glabrata]|uniref:Uncharacterized protein LOC129926885 n=1 Tax=Biomphalaria glabrata TaxID=6526 RepID=A0A9W3APZ5_BIOGL|nr:uncharacterized protein LOC129926885 [Biomphalaria glabrata]